MMARDYGTDDDNRVVAVGLLTRREVSMVGAHLARLYPLDDCGQFADLIEAIDEADRQHHRSANSRGD